MNRIIAWVFLAYMGLSSALFFVVALILWACTAPFDKRLVWLHMFT